MNQIYFGKSLTFLTHIYFLPSVFSLKGRKIAGKKFFHNHYLSPIIAGIAVFVALEE